MFHHQSLLLSGGNETQSSLELRLRRCFHDRKNLREKYADDPERQKIWLLWESILARQERRLIDEFQSQQKLQEAI